MWCACVSRTGSRCPLGLGLPSQETERQEDLALDWFVPDLIIFVFVFIISFLFYFGSYRPCFLYHHPRSRSGSVVIVLFLFFLFFVRDAP